MCCHRDPDTFIRISLSLVFSFDLNRIRVVWVIFFFLLIKKDKQIKKKKRQERQNLN